MVKEYNITINERHLRIIKEKQNIWKLKKVPPMRVEGTIYASDKIMENMINDRTLWQLSNVASLQGIVKHAILMPDGHEGYGFPIGGVAAFNIQEGGIISPGGVGFDINCGVRLLRTNLSFEEIKDKRNVLVDEIFKNVPAGLGEEAKIKFSKEELLEILVEGVDFAIKNGFGWKEDKEHIEENGRMKQVSYEYISDRAMDRGRVQIGSLGSGNHFLEVQVVDKIFDEKAAKSMGITKEGQVMIMIHTGSRGFGHQVASDFLRIMEHHIDISSLPDRELVSVEFNSEIGQQYYLSMNAAANFAFTNRQLITHWVRQSFENILGMRAKDLEMEIVYDVTHNMAKVEDHKVDGEKLKLVVHRKGATRSLGKGNKLLPERYKNIGQPVIIPGSMGTASYVLLGSEKAEQISFSSTAHGAGRVMSRKKAIKTFTKNQIEKLLLEKGVYVRSDSWRGVVEEAPQVYKDIDEVAKVSDEVGIGTLVARLVPVGVVKG